MLTIKYNSQPICGNIRKKKGRKIGKDVGERRGEKELRKAEKKKEKVKVKCNQIKCIKKEK